MGGLAGYFSGFLVWNFVYSIGSRVVSDDIYASLEDDLMMWSAVVGAVLGVAPLLAGG